MNETVTVNVRVLPGRSLTAADGRLVQAGETVELARAEADFAVAMGAAEIVTAEAQKPVKAKARAD